LDKHTTTRKYYKELSMQVTNASNFLKYLHKLEQEFSNDLLSLEKKELVEDVRATFLKEYRRKYED